MSKKFFSLALCFILLVSFSACSSESTEGDLNKEYIQSVRDAADKLESTYTDYIIANTLDAPDGTTQYIEVAHAGDCYTEYSVDNDGNYGTIEYGTEENITYALNDWVTKDGKYYIFSADDGGNDIIYTLPDSYSKYVEDRTSLYVNDLLNNAKSIEKDDDFTADLGFGEETFSCYTIKVDSKAVKEILGVSSYGIYSTIQEDEGADTDIGKLCGYYLEDINMNLTFSDANIIIGIDNNGILRYMCLETGGLGTRLYLTKAVVATQNNNVRTTPDFTEAVKYSTTLEDMAEYVASFDSYEDAINSLDENTIIEETDLEESTEVTTEEVIESSEERKE